MMSLLEGHGDVTMDRAGAAEVPGAAHFSQVLHERRTQARGLTRLMSKLLGLDAKMRQYAEGERFVESVEAAGGPALLARVWEGPEWLPTLEEIRDPADVGGPGRWVSGSGAGVPASLAARPRCPALHLPAAGHRRWPAPCRAAPTRWRSWSWPSPPGATSRRSTSTTACAPDRTPRPASWPAAAPRFGARFESRPGRGAAGAQPRGPGPGRPLRGAARRAWRPGTPWTTRPRPSWSTCCAGPAPTAWPAWSRASGTRCSACAAPRRTPCARRPASAPVCDASNADPAFVRNRVRHELLPLCARGGRSRPGAAAGPAGRGAARRGGAHGVAGRRRAARPGRRPGGGAGAAPAGPARPCGASAPRGRRRRPPAVAGRGRPHPRGGRGRRASGRSWRGACGCAAPAAGSGWSSRAAPVVSRR